MELRLNNLLNYNPWLTGGKGEWLVTVRFSIPMRDYNMLAASWVTVTLKVLEV
jgi:hypothetical protein